MNHTEWGSGAFYENFFGAHFVLLFQMHSRIRRVPEFHNMELVSVSYTSHQFPRHWHDIYVIQAVEQGINELLCNGTCWSLPAATVLLINPGEVHTGASRENRLLRYRSFYVSGAFLAEMTRDLTGRRVENPVFARTVVADPGIAAGLLRAHDAMENEADALEIHSLLLAAFSGLLLAHLTTPMDCTEPRNERAAVLKIQRYLRERHAEKIQLRELARLTGLSPFHLLRCFRRVTGLAPFEFLRNVRVEKARDLLSRGESIVEAAMATGFCDQSHLTRHFTRVLGITPGRYRAISSKTLYFC